MIEKERVSASLTVSECDLLHGGCTDIIDVAISSSLPFTALPAVHHHLISKTDSLMRQSCDSAVLLCYIAQSTAI